MKSVTNDVSNELAGLGLPWTSQEFPFLSVLLSSARDVPGEIALALGGSYASGSNVTLSDLDLFFYVSDRDALREAESLRLILATHPAAVTSCPPQHYHSFGYRCAWTLRDQPVSLVELFVSSALDLKISTMARANNLLIDRSPTYRRHMDASRLLSEDTSEEILELILHDLVAGAQKTRKAINTRSFLSAANRFYKFRMACLPIFVFQCTNVLHHPLVGEKHAPSMDLNIRSAIQQSYQLSTVEDVAHHLKILTGLLQPGIRAMCELGKVTRNRAIIVSEHLCAYALRS